MNVPWPAGMGDAEYLAAFDRVLLPIARSFSPELVLVSAGFDAAAGDLLGGMRVSPEGYAAMTERLLSLADGRVVLALEGGYNLDAIARSAAACLRVLLGEKAGRADFGPASRVGAAEDRGGDRGAAGVLGGVVRVRTADELQLALLHPLSPRVSGGRGSG